MNLQYVETNRLRPNPNNMFTPLAGVEYEELKNSINDKGVLDPLMVRKENGYFIVYAGHNRLKVAQELGIEELPCQVLTSDSEFAEEAAIDTELFRRHLSGDEKREILLRQLNI